MDDRQAQELFDRGVDEFNSGQFHAAHETWEEVWRETREPLRRWLQGLIQFSAAYHHFQRGFYVEGYHGLLERAARNTDGYAGETLNIDWQRLREDLGPWIAHGRAVRDGLDWRQGTPGSPPTIHPA